MPHITSQLPNNQPYQLQLLELLDPAPYVLLKPSTMPRGLDAWLPFCPSNGKNPPMRELGQHEVCLDQRILAWMNPNILHQTGPGPQDLWSYFFFAKYQ